jgi:hypothetical protein
VSAEEIEAIRSGDVRVMSDLFSDADLMRTDLVEIATSPGRDQPPAQFLPARSARLQFPSARVPAGEVRREPEPAVRLL